jgi:uncharacterized membrane protein YhaH (DUF805 family)
MMGLLLWWISFKGRISLRHYWLFYLLPLFAMAFLTQALDVALFGWPDWQRLPGLIPSAEAATVYRYDMTLAGPISTIWFWISFIPGLAGMTKRWHDRGATGWRSALLLIPVFGWIWVFISLCCRDGQRGPNRFGPDPLEARG